MTITKRVIDGPESKEAKCYAIGKLLIETLIAKKLPVLVQLVDKTEEEASAEPTAVP